jgi:hypothetical protein
MKLGFTKHQSDRLQCALFAASTRKLHAKPPPLHGELRSPTAGSCEVGRLAMSIPDWTFAEDYYAGLLDPSKVEIRTDPVKGKGLFAVRDFESGEELLRETALCCSQNLDEYIQAIPVCQHCLVSLETPRDIVLRVAGKKYAGQMPAAADTTGAVTKVPCRNHAGGCRLAFCSEACEAHGWANHHSVLCHAVLSPKGRDAFEALTKENWVQDGVDFSDTTFLGFRFIAHFTARRRRGHSLEASYAQIAQLIRAPVSKFTFSYLLAEDYERDKAKPPANETEKEAIARRWKHFQKFKNIPDQDPIVQAGKSSKRSKADMVQRALELMTDIFAWTEEERAFMTPLRLSELLGAVLLNGQERSPNSPYVAYAAEARRADKAALLAVHKAMRAHKIDVTALEASSHGQGIYPVGACFNHNCAPNIQVSYVDRNDETLVVHTLRSVAAGEELCISYINEDDAVQVRQQQLYEHYLFTCGCDTCRKHLSEIKA